jgi:hypothetical protein
MIWKKGSKYLKTSTMVTVIFMQSAMEIALPLKKLSSKNWSNLSGVWRFSMTNFKLPQLTLMIKKNIIKNILKKYGIL